MGSSLLGEKLESLEVHGVGVKHHMGVVAHTTELLQGSKIFEFVEPGQQTSLGDCRGLFVESRLFPTALGLLLLGLCVLLPKRRWEVELHEKPEPSGARQSRDRFL